MDKIILVGNPNCGKSTIFNKLTKLHAHTGNWQGVTVNLEYKKVSFGGSEYSICDLPGIYGLNPYSPEENVSIQHIFDSIDAIFVNIVDINNIERSLNLTLQLLELNLKVVVLFNFCERAKKRGVGLDLDKFVKVAKVNADMINLTDKNYADKFFKLVKKAKASKPSYLEKFNLLGVNNTTELNSAIRKIEGVNDLEKNASLIKNSGLDKITKCRQDFISTILKNSFTASKSVYGESKLDKIFLNKFFAIPTFLLIILGIFAITFGAFGSFLSELVENLVNFCGKGISALLVKMSAPNWFISFFDEALLSGLGGILSFLPQVLLLFLAMQFLEQTGYLTRLAWLLDPYLKKLGLSGRSIFSILMGFGCTTTALPTTAILKDKRTRIKTALFVPFVSCSAKLPVFACISGAFFGNFSVFVIFGLYLLGIICAILLALLAQKILPTKANDEIIEFTPLTLPKFKTLAVNTLQALWQFLRKIATIILSFTIIIWILSNFTITFQFITSKSQISILQNLATLLSPIFAPLGFSWGAVATLMVGLVAKEMIISSIAVLNNVSGLEIAGSLLDSNSVVGFTLPSCLAFLTFCLLYTPCISAMAQLKAVVPKKVFWLFALFQIIFAYAVSLIVYLVVNVANSGVNLLWAVLIAILVGFCSYFLLKKCCCDKKSCACCNFCNK